MKSLNPTQQAIGRAIQFLIPPHDTPDARAAVLSQAQESLSYAASNLIRAGHGDMAERVHAVLRDIQARA